LGKAERSGRPPKAVPGEKKRERARRGKLSQKKVAVFVFSKTVVPLHEKKSICVGNERILCVQKRSFVEKRRKRGKEKTDLPMEKENGRDGKKKILYKEEGRCTRTSKKKKME